VLWNILEDYRRIYHRVDLVFQWKIPLGLSGLVGLIAASTGANRATDSNMLGGQSILYIHMGSMWWKSIEFHGAVWRIIPLQHSSP